MALENWPIAPRSPSQGAPNPAVGLTSPPILTISMEKSATAWKHDKRLGFFGRAT